MYDNDVGDGDGENGYDSVHNRLRQVGDGEGALPARQHRADASEDADHEQVVRGDGREDGGEQRTAHGAGPSRGAQLKRSGREAAVQNRAEMPDNGTSRFRYSATVSV